MNTKAAHIIFSTRTPGEVNELISINFHNAIEAQDLVPNL